MEAQRAPIFPAAEGCHDSPSQFPLQLQLKFSKLSSAQRERSERTSQRQKQKQEQLQDQQQNLQTVNVYYFAKRSSTVEFPLLEASLTRGSGAP